mmetsp:Transcript_30733/g.69037  ORF Transcript_30733/g.69037 Transcript_30733/m.69037 type:complete len:219 (-) Transcript_30733:129-785(-)
MRPSMAHLGAIESDHAHLNAEPITAPLAELGQVEGEVEPRLRNNHVLQDTHGLDYQVERVHDLETTTWAPEAVGALGVPDLARSLAACAAQGPFLRDERYARRSNRIALKESCDVARPPPTAPLPGTTSAAATAATGPAPASASARRRPRRRRRRGGNGPTRRCRSQGQLLGPRAPAGGCSCLPCRGCSFLPCRALELLSDATLLYQALDELSLLPIS